MAIPIFFSPDLGRSLEFLKVPYFQRDFMTYALLLVFFYINYYVLVPNLYFQKKYIQFSVALVLWYLGIAYLPLVLIPATPPVGHLPHHHGMFFLHHFSQFLVVLLFSGMLKINNRWKEAERQRLTADLSFLKAQVNPHFFFNSLNSIYSLALMRSDKTAPAVVKLSGMMRYVIVDAAMDHVSLDKEVQYIEDYVEMQRVRLGDTMSLAYKADISTPGLQISPLMLIPFVENAFKYGVNPEEESPIRLEISTSGRNLIMILENRKVVRSLGENLRGGVGIVNVRSRLKLLYPGKHDLLIKEDSDKFSVYLSITL
ncbi:MAG: sensor histidine kinase [Bacteroidetes bacterium]|nr:sensor histidine kinase [Bacteroidota bacterium]